jgi:hypothetical protein
MEIRAAIRAVRNRAVKYGRAEVRRAAGGARSHVAVWSRIDGRAVRVGKV